MPERWIDVLGFEGLYKVSSEGRIKSLPRIIRTKQGQKRGYTRSVEGRILRYSLGGGVNGRRYPKVGLSNCGRVTHMYVHHVVWTSFRGVIPEPLEVNHIDGNKKNNNLTNLEIGTRQHNTHHAMVMGLSRIHFKGSKNPGAVLTESKVRKIKQRLRRGENQTKIAKDVGVCKQTITLIKQGRLWSHVE